MRPFSSMKGRRKGRVTEMRILMVLLRALIPA